VTIQFFKSQLTEPTQRFSECCVFTKYGDVPGKNGMGIINCFLIRISSRKTPEKRCSSTREAKIHLIFSGLI
jgi:hypothetical protein